MLIKTILNKIEKFKTPSIPSLKMFAGLAVAQHNTNSRISDYLSNRPLLFFSSNKDDRKQKTEDRLGEIAMRKIVSFR